MPLLEAIKNKVNYNSAAEEYDVDDSFNDEDDVILEAASLGEKSIFGEDDDDEDDYGEDDDDEDDDDEDDDDAPFASGDPDESEDTDLGEDEDDPNFSFSSVCESDVQSVMCDFDEEEDHDSDLDNDDDDDDDDTRPNVDELLNKVAASIQNEVDDDDDDDDDDD